MRWFSTLMCAALLPCAALTACNRPDPSEPVQPIASNVPAVVTPEAPVSPSTDAAQPSDKDATDPAPVADAAPTPAKLDDRSTAVNLIRSYYNAINRHEYSRAHDYWNKGSAVQPLADFKRGFYDTAYVDVEFGEVTSDAGMSQRWSSVPVVLSVTTTAGRTRWFGGCYVTHLTVPEVQNTPPPEPMSIDRAKMTAAGNLSAARKLAICT